MGESKSDLDELEKFLRSFFSKTLPKFQVRSTRHPVVRATDKVDALEIQIHHRDPGAARNLIFNSVLSPMVVINFTLINFVYFDLSLLLSNQYGELKRSAPKFGTSKTITKETGECFHLYLSYFTSVT